MFLAVAAKVTRNDPPNVTCAHPVLGPLRAGHFNYAQQNDPSPFDILKTIGNVSMFIRFSVLHVKQRIVQWIVLHEHIRL